MANLNKVMLIGNLTRDPKLDYLKSNTPVVEFGIAVNRRFRRQDGSQGEETLFIDCRAFGRAAEILNQYMKKGNQIFIEGRLQLDRWQDKNGNPRSKHRVHIESFQFLGGPRNGGDDGGGSYADEGGSYGSNGGNGGNNYGNGGGYGNRDNNSGGGNYGNGGNAGNGGGRDSGYSQGSNAGGGGGGNYDDYGDVGDIDDSDIPF